MSVMRGHVCNERSVSYLQDEDVVAERQRVLSDSVGHQAAVLIKNLTKVYPGSLKMYPGTLKRCSYTPAKPAVQGISLAIPNGECFGLLGVNGAGKTSVFGILTGDIAMTDGTAVIAGYDIRSNLRQASHMRYHMMSCDQLLHTYKHMHTHTHTHINPPPPPPPPSRSNRALVTVPSLMPSSIV